MTDCRLDQPATQRADWPLPVEERLTAHLTGWLGSWPPTAPIQLVGSAARDRPGWDGRVRPVIGVAAPTGIVISVPLDIAVGLDPRPTDLAALAGPLSAAVGVTGGQFGQGIFRWSESATAMPDAGIWLSADDRRLPPWLVPFGGEALVALDEYGQYMAGVGLKRHDRFAQEIAVGTDEAFRGLGLARRLVAQAARRILADGAVPTYLHDPANLASAHVADAAGFPDRGWRIVAFWGVGDEPPG